jgi:hypothetical protein
MSAPLDAPKCPLCAKVIPSGKGVDVRIAGKTQKYRCIHCALSGMKGEKKTYEILAKTPLDRKTVVLKHTPKGWSQTPKETVFLILPERADECLDLHQPFASMGEFRRYLKAHPEIAAQKPKPYTIAHYEQMLLAGKG